MSSSPTTDCTCRISKDFDILRQTEVFSGAPAEVIKLFAYLARHRVYHPGETIISQGRKADGCFFVIRGEVNITILHKGEEIFLQRIRENSFFGELALVARFNWCFSAKSVNETELLIIDRESFQKILDKYPEKRDQLTEKVIQLRISRFEDQTAYLLDRLLEAGIAAGSKDRPLFG